MNIILFLLVFPAVVSLLFAVLPPNSIRNTIVRLSCLLIAAGSVYAAFVFSGLGTTFFKADVPPVHLLFFTIPDLNMWFFIGDMVVSLFLLYKCMGIKAKEWYIPVLIILQAGIMIYCERSGIPEVERPFYIDNFSIIMALIIGIIGSLICWYAVSYMKDYHHHHPEMKDRQRSFFFILFFFLSAMFGVVFSNNLVWLFFFWEITTLSSFILIGYPKTEEATRNAYRALGFNLIGGLGFACGILYLVKFCPGHSTVDLAKVIQLGSAVMLIPVALISFAGIAKSAQMPFSSWLLGAMVAPTPVSALLHSSTMVKAGIFIIIKFAPVFQGTWAGYCIALVGAITFLMTSIIAVTQNNAKRVLAYSTIANLGLIIACAGIGTYETVWAALMLTIFHAVSKGLLFLGVGSIEHKIGSRDIEDMEGLIVNRPGLATVMLIGILGMFLAPFGMLISKWACLEAFVRSTVAGVPTGVLLAVLLAFGSAPTLFFWTKWMGKIVTVPATPKLGEGRVSGDEWVALGVLALLTVATAGLFPLLSSLSVEPYIISIYHQTVSLTQSSVIIMSIMLSLLVLLPLAFFTYPRNPILVQRYLAGTNQGKTNVYLGALGRSQEATMRNYYLTTLFKESALTKTSIFATIAVIAAMFAVVKL